MEATRESLKETIKGLAIRNLDKEPTPNHEKQKLFELHNELRQVREEYKSVRGQYGI